MKSNFNKTPAVKISDKDCLVGWNKILAYIKKKIQDKKLEKTIIAIECYHGVDDAEVEKALKRILNPDYYYKTSSFFKSSEDIKQMVYPFVTDDKVFGYMTNLKLENYFDKQKFEAFNTKLIKQKKGVTIVYGVGASKILLEKHLIIYLDMPRWEIQLRMRKNLIGNLGVLNKNSELSLRYKQAYFNDWRVLDSNKTEVFDNCDYFIDTTKSNNPKMLSKNKLLAALHKVVEQPFRVVPFFDPGVWGGQWLKERMDLDQSVINYAWGFDCVPEENSLLLQFGTEIFETPSLNLVFRESKALLGDYVYKKFGAEFPIRFDFLDTMEGGNLSLQVHPTKEYIKEKFGMNYTQDESYYLLDAKVNAHVYLGLCEDIEADSMIQDLKKAEKGEAEFNTEKYVNKWDIKKHNHLLIPAGTVHCSGKDNVVLEVSATPYIFTFKLWDWGRLDLDGKPRPINIEHGKKVIQWDRKTKWTKENLINRIEQIDVGDGWTEERTGLHPEGFIETRRHWFTKKTLHKANGSVTVINLVEGREAIVESPEGLFEAFIVHYAETFIVPADIKEYTITPYGESKGKRCGTLKAYVRCNTAHNIAN